MCVTGGGVKRECKFFAVVSSCGRGYKFIKFLEVRSGSNIRLTPARIIRKKLRKIIVFTLFARWWVNGRILYINGCDDDCAIYIYLILYNNVSVYSAVYGSCADTKMISVCARCKIYKRLRGKCAMVCTLCKQLSI